MFRILLAGFAGGMLRGLVGFVKYQYSYKEVKFNLYYFLMMMSISGVIGLVTSTLAYPDVTFAFLAGYAGGDFVENMYKIATGKTTLWDVFMKTASE